MISGTGRLTKKALRETSHSTLGLYSSRMSNLIVNSLFLGSEVSNFVKSISNCARMSEILIGFSFQSAVRSGKRKLGLSSTSFTSLWRVMLTPSVASSTKLGGVGEPSPAVEVTHFSESRTSSRLIAELPLTSVIWNDSSSMKSFPTSLPLTSLPLTLSTYPVLIGPFLSIAMPPPISALPPRASSFFLSASAACLLRLCATTLPFWTMSCACFSDFSYFFTTNLTSELKASSVESVGRRRTCVVRCCRRN
mmetsp:Transcript_21332/g.63692  ORF Transcript_21332/g.63692 Transcript_21332/m.63692 type:complete len:251 (-) Transcript_21332:1061-1813(-)